MNEMFKLIESELKSQRRTKVWFADALNESTQNINNWKTRGVPAAKVKRIAEVLGLSREYLEGDNYLTHQSIASPRGKYKVSERNSVGWPINYFVFIEPNDLRMEQLLLDHLRTKGELSYLLCTTWKHDDPFLEIDIWLSKEEVPGRIYLPINRIIGIADYGSGLHTDLQEI